MENWDQLLPELLTVIVKKVHLYEDFVAFGGVCRSWRSVAVKSNFSQHPLSSSCSVQPPWLMLAENETAGDVREFVSLSKEGMVYKVELPEAQGKWCIGSLGWLITVDVGGSMGLLHPLTQASISLPHLRTYSLYQEDRENHGMNPTAYVHRAMLSASPSTTKDYTVMLILGINTDLAFWKPGNEEWTPVEANSSCHFFDVIHHKDRFYAAGNYDIVVCDLRGPNPTPKVQVVGHMPPYSEFPSSWDGQVYFVECCGDILLVKKVLAIEEKYWTTAFKVCKAADSSLTKWQEVNDLGGTSIFVGHNSAISVPSAAAVGVKPNCIYFTDDYADGYATAEDIIGGKGMGVYDLGSREIEPFWRGTSLSKYCPPIWVSPSF